MAVANDWTLLARDVTALSRLSPVVARLKRADFVEQCPFSGVPRKTFTQIEFF
jgi:hypothetical protein